MVDVGILVLYCVRQQVNDAPEAVTYLLIIWTGPIGFAAIMVFGFATMSLSMKATGFVVGSWILATVAGYCQYFVLLPRLAGWAMGKFRRAP
jgi:hypothetical protein